MNHYKQVLIIDELSMISADLLYDANRRLQSIMASEDPFGSVGVIFLGDILQLPPIKGQPIFLEPHFEQNLALYNSDENLWNNFEVVILECKFRQRNKTKDWALVHERGMCVCK